MPDRRGGFVPIDVLMEAAAGLALAAMVGIMAVQLTVAASSASASREQAHLDAIRRDLEDLRALEATHYAAELTYTRSPSVLSFEGSPGVSIAISASAFGWAAVASHAELDASEGCAIYLGHVDRPTHPVIPRQPGEVACTS